MASSNIKLFDENKGNMLTDTEFNISTQRLNGLQTGVASSLLQNKAMYQTSLVAYAIAQLMLANGVNANDTDAVSAFVANLSGTMLQKVYDIATTAEAQAGVATGKWMSPALTKAAIDALAAKAQNILSDETKTLFGLSASAVPDDVFAWLGDLGNKYVWEKLSTSYSIIEENNLSGQINVCDVSSESDTKTIQYSSSISLDENRNLRLDNPQSLNISTGNYTQISTLVNKYFIPQTPTSQPAINGKIVKITSGNPDYTASGGWRIYFSSGNGKAMGVKTTIVPLGEYVLTEANTPPIEAGYTFNSLGRLGNKSRIATGSYVGTGTYGSSNPNSLTFDFEPKMVKLYARMINDDYAAFHDNDEYKNIYMYPDILKETYVAKLGFCANNISSCFGKKSADGKTLYWYVDGTSSATASYQFNNSGQTYYWLAIG